MPLCSYWIYDSVPMHSSLDFRIQSQEQGIQQEMQITPNLIHMLLTNVNITFVSQIGLSKLLIPIKVCH